MSLLGLPRCLLTGRRRGSSARGACQAARTHYLEKEQRPYHAWSPCRAPPAYPQDRLHYEQHGAAAALRCAAAALIRGAHRDFSSP